MEHCLQNEGGERATTAAASTPSLRRRRLPPPNAIPTPYLALSFLSCLFLARVVSSARLRALEYSSLACSCPRTLSAERASRRSIPGDTRVQN